MHVCPGVAPAERNIWPYGNLLIQLPSHPPLGTDYYFLEGWGVGNKKINYFQTWKIVCTDNDTEKGYLSRKSFYPPLPPPPLQKNNVSSLIMVQTSRKTTTRTTFVFLIGSLDCEQSLFFRSVRRNNKITHDRSPKRDSPYSPLFPSPHLHIFGFSFRS